MIDYTEEMRLNDRLWEMESEDLDLMLKLFHDILYQARKLGFLNPVEIYEANDEICYEIYRDNNHKGACCEGYSEPLKSGGNCKYFIRDLEGILNHSPTTPHNLVEGDLVQLTRPLTSSIVAGLIDTVEVVDSDGVKLEALKLYITNQNISKNIRKVEIK